MKYNDASSLEERNENNLLDILQENSLLQVEDELQASLSFCLQR